MNRDEIIRVAQEAGLIGGVYVGDDEIAEMLERFAVLVSDHMIRNGYRKCAEGQRETQFCGQLEAAVAGAIAAEREACAIAGAAAAMAGKDYVGVAAAIRARGNV